MKAASILETIGNTPHIRINRLFGDRAEVWIKSERANPGASIKDRIALAMVEDAETIGRAQARRDDRRADLGQYRHRPGDGRRGQGLQAGPGHAREHEHRAPPADAGLWRELRPDAARKRHEGRDRARRGDRRRRPTARGCRSSSRTRPTSRSTAAPPRRKSSPISRDSPIDALITGVGTGGHITACAEVLKKEWPGLKVFAVEPTLSPVLSGGEPGPHPIQGIGAGFIPAIMDTSLLDGIIQVDPADAKEMARRAAREEGMLVGISSGATLAAIAQKLPELGDGTRDPRLQLRHRRALFVGARLPARRSLANASLTAFLSRAVNARAAKAPFRAHSRAREWKRCWMRRTRFAGAVESQSGTATRASIREALWFDILSPDTPGRSFAVGLARRGARPCARSCSALTHLVSAHGAAVPRIPTGRCRRRWPIRSCRCSCC